MGAVIAFALLGEAFGVTGMRNPPKGNDDLQVNLYFTRHAESCANLVQHYGTAYRKVAHSLMYDPMISACGAYRSSSSAAAMLDENRLPPFDLVLASSLARAMDTAAYQYPNQTVIAAPFISELSTSRLSWLFTQWDNKPEQVNKQRLRLERRHPGTKFDFSWLLQKYRSSSDREKPSLRKFLRFLTTDLLPAHGLRVGEVNIAVVTHSNFMATTEPMATACQPFFRGKNNRPVNNQVLLVSYVAEDDTLRPTTNMHGRDCSEVWLGFEQKPTLCDADIGEICQEEMSRVSHGVRPVLQTKEREIASILSNLQTLGSGSLRHVFGPTWSFPTEHRPEHVELQLTILRLQERLAVLRDTKCCVT